MQAEITRTPHAVTAIHGCKEKRPESCASSAGVRHELVQHLWEEETQDVWHNCQETQILTGHDFGNMCEHGSSFCRSLFSQLDSSRC